MRIAFVLPAPVRVPMGGAAVVYRYAQGLAARGHTVSVIAPTRDEGAVAWIRRRAILARDVFHRVHQSEPYPAEGVETLEPTTPREAQLDTFDAVIATGHQTAPWVAAEARSGFYFLQGDERALSVSAGDTWTLPLTRFAVSTWLSDCVESHGHSVVGVVPNAVDPAVFGCDEPPAARPRRLIALYHRHRVKGPETLLHTLALVRDRVPDAEAVIVAARPPSHRLPPWVHVEIRPSSSRLREIMNHSSVCLHTSCVEGWGLFPMEAAACGCAIVATASRGPREYLTPDRSMIEVPVGDSEQLANQTVHLLENPSHRIGLAEGGMADVAAFSWGASTDQLEEILATHTSVS